jgi:hypothetical protein
MEEERPGVTLNPEMDGWIYVATWDSDNHGSSYPTKVERFKSFRRYVLEQTLAEASNQ